MTQVTFGPPVRVDGPLPQAPPYSLTATALPVDELDEHFLSGAQVYGYPPGDGNAWDPCSSGTNRAKDEGGAPPLPLFGAFTAYLAETCTSRSKFATTAAFAERAVAAFAARESAIAEFEFLAGHALPLNPHLADSHVTLLNAGAATNPLEALALLEEAIGATRQRGMIHATPGTLTAWNFSGPSISDKGGTLRTSAGTPVAVGDGYIDAHPASKGAPGAHQQWAWATGPVQIRRSTTVTLIPDADQIIWALSRSDNVITYRAERDYLITWESPSAGVWDGGLQAAVLVDRTLTP